MSRNGKVIVAMSGGVDSSVAACLLKAQGYDCVGVFMRVGTMREEPETCRAEGSTQNPKSKIQNRASHRHGCCSASDALDARAVAGRLGIPFYALNFQPDFDRIIDHFVDEYRRARTPNPCVQCNIHIKFGKLLRYADLVDAEFIATGHYARIVEHADRPALARARNLAKDQSYVLFGIDRDDLGRCLFPLGAFPDKAEVRRVAASLGLAVHDKPDSQEICFVPDNDYRRLVLERAPDSQRPGEIRFADGRVLAQHDGIAGFTVGQRRGLGLAVGRPLYVLGLDAAANTVTVGPREGLLSEGLLAERVNWHCDPPAVDSPRPASIKIRHTHTPAPGTICVDGDGAVAARFAAAQSAITPGQAAVFYDGDICMGGGWIINSLNT